MLVDQLDISPQLDWRQLSELNVRKGPRYTRTQLSRPQSNWRPSARLKRRSVWKPCKELKDVQRQIAQLICKRFEPSPIAHAYVRRRGIVTNATMHVRKEWLFQLDLANFFGSIKEKWVAVALGRALPELSAADIRIIANLCCHAGSLPQGAPSSPILSNLVCLELDQQLQDLATELGIVVTRYSDDICFSSADYTFPQELAIVYGRGSAQRTALGEPLSRLFHTAELPVNFSKVRLQRRTERQQVTGLIVNDGVNVPRECYRKVRGALRLWEKYGLDEAAAHCQPQLPKKRFVNSLRGVIDHIGHVTGRDNHYYHLLGQYERLAARDL